MAIGLAWNPQDSIRITRCDAVYQNSEQPLQSLGSSTVINMGIFLLARGRQLGNLGTFVVSGAAIERTLLLTFRFIFSYTLQKRTE